MEQTLILTGAQAAAEAARLSRVQVIAAYPITPQSKIPETLSAYVERGVLQAQFVRVESEHSAMGVCIAASIAGARAFTATSANGLAYMHEQLHWAAGSRLPIVMPVANRGVAAPWTILNDCQDTISQRDTGWMQIYCMNNQEALDLVVVAFKAAEQLLIPCMVCFDGFLLSHTFMPVSMLGQEDVDSYLPPYVPFHTLDADNPVNINPVITSDPIADPDGVMSPGYMGIRFRLQKSLEEALPVLRQAGREFGEIFGRSYEDPLFRYRTEDADFVFVAMGALAGEASEAADALREKGVKAGVLGVRVYRPFPAAELYEALCGRRVAAVIEKAISYGYEGALSSEIKASFYAKSGPAPAITNYIVSLGGKDVAAADLIQVATESIAAAKSGTVSDRARWLGFE
ncbi:MAG: transketolase C-terminal domain-containing protein [Syntrophobacteraceae bacterium]|nr:transketolase C-terminal domain-containing protein [Syntrophobacteraceae bacterium]